MPNCTQTSWKVVRHCGGGGDPYTQYDYDFEFFEDDIVIRLSDRWPDGVVEKHFVSIPLEIFESATDDELLQYAHMKGNEAFDAERFDNIMQVIRKLHRIPRVDVEYVLQNLSCDGFTTINKTRKHIKDNPVDYREEESSGSV